MARSSKEKAWETRESILDAAEAVFYDKGVSSTSLTDIAQAAGVTRGAIYWHFKNKEDLFDAMCQRVRGPMRAMIEEMASPDTADPIGQLRAGGAFVMAQVVDNPHYRKVLTILFHRCEYVDPKDPILIYQREWMAHGISVIRQVMINARAKGQLPADLDVGLAALYLHVIFDGLLNSWLFSPGSFDLVEDARRIMDAVWGGLMNNPGLRNAAGEK